MAPGDLHELAALRLTGEGQRYTRAGRALVDVLADADAPLALPQLLERAGVVHRIVTADEFAATSWPRT